MHIVTVFVLLLVSNAMLLLYLSSICLGFVFDLFFRFYVLIFPMKVLVLTMGLDLEIVQMFLGVHSVLKLYYFLKITHVRLGASPEVLQIGQLVPSIDL
jgi:hypothetical protein